MIGSNYIHLSCSKSSHIELLYLSKYIQLFQMKYIFHRINGNLGMKKLFFWEWD